MQSGNKALDCPDRTAEQVVLNEEMSGLRGCLADLEGKRRRVIELAYFDPALTERAIAEVLCCSPSNVHKLKREGLRRLQACLQRKGIR